MRKHWYKITRYVCVLCGRTTEYRERRYGTRPRRWHDRVTEHDDACCDHF